MTRPASRLVLVAAACSHIAVGTFRARLLDGCDLHSLSLSTVQKCLTDTVQLPNCHCGFSTCFIYARHSQTDRVSFSVLCQCCWLQRAHQHKCRALSLAAVYR